MSHPIMAPEEVRDRLRLEGPQTVAYLADDLYVSHTTIRRALATLQQRDQVMGRYRGNKCWWDVTEKGARASDENESL